MKLEHIKWKQSDHNCKCAVCNGGQAVSVAYIGNWRLPVCPECGQKTESEILKAIEAV